MTRTTATGAMKLAELNRVERDAWTKRGIFDAATGIVGKYGYAPRISSFRRDKSPDPPLPEDEEGVWR